MPFLMEGLSDMRTAMAILLHRSNLALPLPVVELFEHPISSRVKSNAKEHPTSHTYTDRIENFDLVVQQGLCAAANSNAYKKLHRHVQRGLRNTNMYLSVNMIMM